MNIISMEHMQRSLVFSGKEGDKINFLYVEKSGPQTLYSHNVSYNLKDSKLLDIEEQKSKYSLQLMKAYHTSSLIIFQIETSWIAQYQAH